MPSLKPNRLRGVGPVGLGRGRLAEAELRPAHRGAARGDPGQVADGVHRDLRVVGAGLDRQVAVAASRGPGCRRGTPAGRRARRVAARRSPKRSSNSDGPKPTVRVRFAASRPIASPVSDGGARRLRGSPPPTGRFTVMSRAAAVQSWSRATSAARSVVVTSYDAKCRWPCTGVAMPAWCVAVERDPAAGLGTVAGRRGGGQPAGHADRAESAGAREQVPSAHAA